MPTSLKSTSDEVLAELQAIQRRFDEWQSTVETFGRKYGVKPVTRRVHDDHWCVVGVHEAPGTGTLEGKWCTPSKGIIYPQAHSALEKTLRSMTFEGEHCSSLPTMVTVTLPNGRMKNVPVKPLIQGGAAYVDIPDGKPNRPWDRKLWKTVFKGELGGADEETL